MAEQRMTDDELAVLSEEVGDMERSWLVWMTLVLGLAGLTLIAGACSLSDSRDVPDSTSEGLTDAQYDQLAGALTAHASERHWCYKRDGSLDSRDGYILTVTAEDIARSLFGAAFENVIREDKLMEALLDRNWSRFTGPDYDGGGTEFRYRPPGCR